MCISKSLTPSNKVSFRLHTLLLLRATIHSGAMTSQLVEKQSTLQCLLWAPARSVVSYRPPCQRQLIMRMYLQLLQIISYRVYLLQVMALQVGDKAEGAVFQMVCLRGRY